MRTSFAIDSFGNTYEYNLDTCERIDYQVGDGFLKTITSKVVAKLTGKTAKDIAQKAVTKAVEKGAEQIGNKTGEIISNKLNSAIHPEKKGDQIREVIKVYPPNKQYQQDTTNPDTEIIKMKFNKLIKL